MSAATDLRRAAEAAASGLPAVLVAAEHLASALSFGGHGLRRAGAGAEFWQYRPAVAGDEVRLIDWRRSARGDQQILRQREQEVSQSLWLWVDPSAGMRYSSDPNRPDKAYYARKLALAFGILALRAGERVGALARAPLSPRTGRAQIAPLAQALLAEAPEEGLPPPEAPVPSGAQVLLISDFIADPAPLAQRLAGYAALGVQGALLQLLDPAEEDFPFSGRVLFESMGGGVQYEASTARALKAEYQARLAARRAELGAMAAKAGWQFGTHRSDHPSAGALVWLAGALGRQIR